MLSSMLSSPLPAHHMIVCSYDRKLINKFLFLSCSNQSFYLSSFILIGEIGFIESRLTGDHAPTSGIADSGDIAPLIGAEVL